MIASALLVLAAQALPALNAVVPWEELPSDRYGRRQSFDPTSIRREGDLAWVVFRQVGEGPLVERVTLFHRYRIDCRARRFGAEALAFYGPDGQPTLSEERNLSTLSEEIDDVPAMIRVAARACSPRAGRR